MPGWFKKRDKRHSSDAHAPPGTIVYAIGDIHGRLDLLLRLESLIDADAVGHPAVRRVIVYLGDYIDRGDDSCGVIEHLSGTPREGFERVYLIGNHEAYMLRFLDDVSVLGPWFANGGRETLVSYGVEPAGRGGDARQASDVQSEFRRKLPEAHKAFLDGLAYSHREGDYMFVHAGVRPGIGLERQNSDDLIWIRDEFLRHDGDFGAVVVHGHSIREQPESKPNRIGIDTGAYATGRLTGVALWENSRRFLNT